MKNPPTLYAYKRVRSFFRVHILSKRNRTRALDRAKDLVRCSLGLMLHDRLLYRPAAQKVNNLYNLPLWQALTKPEASYRPRRDNDNSDERGGGQNWKLLNVERPIFRNFPIVIIKIQKGELFDNFIFKLFTSIFWKLFQHLKYLMIFDIVKYWFSKWYNFKKFSISKIFKCWKFLNFLIQ